MFGLTTWEIVLIAIVAGALIGFLSHKKIVAEDVKLAAMVKAIVGKKVADAKATDAAKVAGEIAKADDKVAKVADKVDEKAIKAEEKK